MPENWDSRWLTAAVTLSTWNRRWHEIGLDRKGLSEVSFYKALGTRAIGRMRGVCVGNLNDPSRRCSNVAVVNLSRNKISLTL